MFSYYISFSFTVNDPGKENRETGHDGRGLGIFGRLWGKFSAFSKKEKASLLDKREKETIISYINLWTFCPFILF